MNVVGSGPASQSGKCFVLPRLFFRLGADLHFDERSRLYLSKTVELRKLYPPVSGTIRPENMPGYRDPCVCTNLATDNPAAPVTTGAENFVDPVIAPLLTSILLGRSGGHEYCL